MGDSIGSIASIAAVLVSLLVSAGWGLQRNRVGSLRVELSDERKLTASLREERTDDRQKIADLQAVVRIATGEIHAQAILDLLEHHATESHKANVRTEDLLTEVLDILHRRPPGPTT